MAAAWNPGRGQSYSQLSLTGGSTNTQYDQSGTSKDLPGDYSQASASLYSEVGVSDRWAVFGSFPLIRRDHLDTPSLTSTGVGDFSLGMRWNLIPDKPVALQVTQRFPTGDSDSENGRLPLGPGDYATTGELAAGVPLPWWNITAEGVLGYRLRNAGYSDEFVFSSSVYRPWGKWAFAFQVFGQQAVKNGNINTGSRSLVGTYRNNTSFIAFGPRVAYQWSPRWGAHLEFEGAGRVRNLHSGVFPRLGISYRGG